MILNEIKCHVNTSLGLVGGCIPCIPPVSAPVGNILLEPLEDPDDPSPSTKCCPELAKDLDISLGVDCHNSQLLTSPTHRLAWVVDNRVSDSSNVVWCP